MNQQTTASQSGKKTYEQPLLQVYGDLAEITLHSNSSKMVADGATSGNQCSS
jgi:hypothetical protein